VQIFVEEAVIVTDGTLVGFTVTVFVALTAPHDPPAVVRVKMMEEGAFAGAVYVAVLGEFPVLLEKFPPETLADQTADVAPPPYEPPKAPVVPPWQMAAIAPPIFTVGVGFTVIVLEALTV
tara:strand:+ start:1622 stop:1984 length:363 start_codon:yes stop_codon:yes gene_type:complete